MNENNPQNFLHFSTFFVIFFRSKSEQHKKLLYAKIVAKTSCLQMKYNPQSKNPKFQT
jgi:hypothetical protein